MDFLQALKAHKGGLLRIKSELFWYGGHGWDNSPGRICLVLDASAAAPAPYAAWPAEWLDLDRLVERQAAAGAVLLLIDGCPQWIWVAKADVEVL